MPIVLSGLPGVGKTTIARELAHALAAVHLRIDSIEQALRHTGLVVETEGYTVAHAVAADNLRVGRTVVADSVNPWSLTRDEWRAVGEQMGVPVVEVEVVCSDQMEHRRRVESRVADIVGHRLPTWEEVVVRDYRAWDRPRLVIDTARRTVQESVQAVVPGKTRTNRACPPPPSPLYSGLSNRRHGLRAPAHPVTHSIGAPTRSARRALVQLIRSASTG